MDDRTRYFIVRGAGVLRAEQGRDAAGRILVNVAPGGWPFPRWRWCERSELVFASGRAEPEPGAAATREPLPAVDEEPALWAEPVALELF